MIVQEARLCLHQQQQQRHQQQGQAEQLGMWEAMILQHHHREAPQRLPIQQLRLC